VAQAASNAATAYLSLGMADLVDVYSERAMPDIQRSASPWSRTLIMLDRATAVALSERGDLERAASLAVDALNISVGRPIVAVQQRAGEFVRLATHRWGDTPQVRQVHEVAARELVA
jgi:hypothetical protein